MKKYFFMTTVVFILCGLFVLADSATDKLDALKKKRADASMQLYNRRLKLIEDDPKLRDIHEKILLLHKELALRLDNDREIIELYTRIRDIDAEIEKLSETMKDGKKEEKKEETPKDKKE